MWKGFVIFVVGFALGAIVLRKCDVQFNVEQAPKPAPSSSAVPM